MKLALVTETYPPEINGVAMTLGRLAKGLADRSVNLEVVAPNRSDRKAENKESLFTVPGLPIPRYPELRFGLPAHIKLKKHWKANRPDAVHVATEGPLGWSALRIAKQLNIPTVSSYHTNFHSYGSHYGYGWLAKAVLAWMRHCHDFSKITFAPSSDIIEELESKGFKNLQLFARGVDSHLFGPHRRSETLRQSWGVHGDEPVAVYVGRLANEKNIQLTTKAALSLKEQFTNLKLVYVGDGPARTDLERRFPDAHFAGMQTGEQLAEHYASADFFLFASITETFGNVVTEAMASGLPVVAYNYAAPARFIKDSENGFLADFNDESAFLNKTIELARRRSDWKKIGAAARKTLEPHSWDAIVDAYLEAVREILN